MTVVLRPYQQQAVDALFDYFATNSGNPIVSIPTGGGKSLVQAAFIQRTLATWSGERFLCVTHVKELLKQNAAHLERMCPGVSVGVYSAGLNSRQIDKQITVAGVQSVHARAHELGDISIAIVDECFTGDTIISTPGGGARIDTLAAGDKVLCATGVGRVVAVSKRRTNDILQLRFDDGTTIRCTSNHKFFTPCGWKEAGQLGAGEVSFSEEGVRLLRRVVYSKRKKQTRSSDNAGGKCVEKARILLNILCEESQEPCQEPCCAKKNKRHTQEDWPQADQTRRKRQPVADTATGPTARAWGRVGGRACRCHEDAIKTWISDMLQDRHSQPRTHDCDRDRWRESLPDREARARQEKVEDSCFPRLVSVSRVKSKGPRSVFNIHVSGHPSYYANGKLVHNCHLLSRKSESMYGRLFKELRRYCPHMKIIGMSATPWRMDSGALHKGDGAIFTDVAYRVSIKDLIDHGYLANIVSAPTKQIAKSSKVKKQGGEYMAGDLERAINTHDITSKALDAVEQLAADRKAWLVFCVGVDHANAVAAAIRERGYSAAVVVGDTPKQERDDTIEQFKAGKVRALVSVGVLTTGFDAPNADALVCLRPTCSAALWVQMVGRITRLAPGKVDGLVLDFTSNSKKHGPIDLITMNDSGELSTAETRDAPLKVCPQCFAEVPASGADCQECGYVFEVLRRVAKHNTEPARENLLSVAVPQIVVERVISWSFNRHRKVARPDSVCVKYVVDMATSYAEWLCFDHGGYAATKAAVWWVENINDGLNAPRSTREALERLRVYTPPCPATITVKRNGKYWSVIGRSFAQEQGQTAAPSLKQASLLR